MEVIFAIGLTNRYWNTPDTPPFKKLGKFTLNKYSMNSFEESRRSNPDLPSSKNETTGSKKKQPCPSTNSAPRKRNIQEITLRELLEEKTREEPGTKKLAGDKGYVERNRK
ncbi:hypothetical protein K0M31_002474 [Melipona bicolor]|uniref:Uncharacterized protein n=1 Tax=Melipona bicolor TaxID=60889 RepID=A0AA40GHK9_9HYME|nr:hypothetical protein K0M31_002474 [Melipona bicolor]